MSDFNPMDTTPSRRVDPRRCAPVRVVDDIDAPDWAPGDMMPVRRNGTKRDPPWGYAYRCVGCGLETALPLAPQDKAPAWRVEAGDPHTGAGLTLSPSIWHHGGPDGCEWHGYLTNGVFSPC